MHIQLNCEVAYRHYLHSRLNNSWPDVANIYIELCTSSAFIFKWMESLQWKQLSKHTHTSQIHTQHRWERLAQSPPTYTLLLCWSHNIHATLRESLGIRIGGTKIYLAVCGRPWGSLWSLPKTMVLPLRAQHSTECGGAPRSLVIRLNKQQQLDAIRAADGALLAIQRDANWRISRHGYDLQNPSVWGSSPARISTVELIAISINFDSRWVIFNLFCWVITKSQLANETERRRRYGSDCTIQLCWRLRFEQQIRRCRLPLPFL